MRNEFMPFFRSTVGFDQLLNSLVDRANETADDYPPYNIARIGEDAYRVTVAATGFAADEIEIVVQDNFFVVSSKTAGEPTGEFLHRGIASRPFSRRFQLADHVRVDGASLENGLLSIDLVREVPEAKKPRTVKITSRPPTLTTQAA